MSNKKIKVIDTHTYWNFTSELEGNEKGVQGTLTDNSHFKLKKFDETAFLTIPNRISNNFDMPSIVRNNKNIFGYYILFNPNIDIEFLGYISSDKVFNLLEDENCIGIKTQPSLSRTPVDHEDYFPFYDAANKLKKPVLIHCSSTGSDYTSASQFYNITKHFPKLKIIMAHFGGFKYDYMTSAVDLAVKNENIFLNTTCMGISSKKTQLDIKTGQLSVLEMPDIKDILLDRFLYGFEKIPNQILLGTDLGFDTLENYSYFPIDNLSKEDQDKILFDNPKRLFNLKELF